MMKQMCVALTAVLLAATAQAQGPAQAPARQPTPEQMQQAMMMQMQLMAAMFDLKTSKLGFDETVAAIKASAEKRGWKVDQIHDMQAAMKAGGAKDAQRMKVIPACPAGANDKLAKAGQGKVPPLPCRVTVFEGKDGKVQVVRFNTALVAKSVQGEAANVLAEVAGEEEAMLKGIVQ